MIPRNLYPEASPWARDDQRLLNSLFNNKEELWPDERKKEEGKKIPAGLDNRLIIITVARPATCYSEIRVKPETEGVEWMINNDALLRLKTQKKFTDNERTTRS